MLAPQLLKNNNASTIQSIVCDCFSAIKRSFCVNMWQQMKHGSTTSFWSQIDSQLSRQQHVKAIQSDQRSKHQQTKFWTLFWDAQGILFIDYLEKGRTIYCKYYIALLVCLKKEIAKKHPQMKKKKVFLHRDNAPCHKLIAMMAKLHETILQIAILQIWPPATTSCRPQKNAPRKEI